MVFDRLLLPAFAESPSGVRAAVSTFFASLRGDRVGTASASVFRGRSVGDVMKTGVVTVGEDTPLEEVVRIMVEKGIKRIPVVDPDGTFRGILGRDALLRHGHTPTTGS
jgi:CBS domain-containing protein